MTTFPRARIVRSPDNPGAFAFGLDRILDGLERIRPGASPSRARDDKGPD
jgi:hypothetical protein